MDPTITLVIPTRERAETLSYTLRTALDQKTASYEILVSDNCSQDATRDVVGGFTDPRIRYVNTGKRLSMCDNWEFALQHARGAYVIFIGDDDAVFPNGIDRLESLIRERPSPAYTWTPPIYHWPIDDRPASFPFLPPPPAIHELDLARMARFAVAHGGWRYTRLPGAYHASLSREILDSIRRKASRVFRSTQPDLFTSMSTPVFTARGLHTGLPVTLNGASRKSHGAATHVKEGALEINRVVEEYRGYTLHPTLYPGIPVDTNMIIDAFLVAMDTYPEYYGSMKFNYSAMWAFLVRFGKVTPSEVLRKKAEIRKYHAFSTAAFLWYVAIQKLAQARLKSFSRSSSRAAFAGEVPSNIADAARALSEWHRSFLPTPP